MSAQHLIWTADGTALAIALIAGIADWRRVNRQLAAWAVILAVPTAIADIYGMSFDNMRELRMRYAYFVVQGVIASTCGWLFYRFKRARWL